jgi:RNase P/RNase MRP subunit p30
MPEYYDLDVRFWEADLESYANSLGFRSICSFSPEGSGLEMRVRRAEDIRFKKEGKIILISSDDAELLKKACKRDVDMLFFPRFMPDVGLLRAASENRKPFEIPVSLLLERRGADRAFLISKMSTFLRLCNKYGADFILTSGASGRISMKTPGELTAVGEVLGLSHDQAVKSISMIPRYILEGLE